MFTHAQQNSVWSEGLGPQAEILPSQKHGSGQQWFPGQHIFNYKCWTYTSSLFSLGFVSSCVSCGSPMVRAFSSLTLKVFRQFKGWRPTSRHLPSSPWQPASACGQRRQCGSWTTISTRCCCSTLPPTSSVLSTGNTPSFTRNMPLNNTHSYHYTRAKRSYNTSPGSKLMCLQSG